MATMSLASIAIGASAADNNAVFDEHETTLCYNGQALVINIPVRVTTANANELFTLNYDNGGQIETVTVTNGEVTNGIYNIKRTLSMAATDNHSELTCKLLSISTQKDGTKELDDTYYIHLYAVPSPEIMTDAKICGLSTELKANEKWSDISTYAWEVSEGTLTNADQATATLSIPKQTTITATLTETTGGKCVNTVSKTITMQRTPQGSITLADNVFGEDSVVICSSLPNETNLDFGATVNLLGNAPFSVETTDGTKFSGLTLGDNDINLKAVKTDNISISDITDRNGCHATEAERQGLVRVKDRKPMPVAPTDTALHENNKDIKIGITLTEPQNSYELVAAEDIEDYTISYSYPGEGNTVVKTNMNGLHNFYYVETNNEGNACEERVRVTIMVRAVADAPNGFSPNGDGQNDYLVIDGLTEENHVMVFDAMGKVVFECQNYHNDWSAEGVEDGYYTYVAEGKGMKTFKETLVIKRTK